MYRLIILLSSAFYVCADRPSCINSGQQGSFYYVSSNNTYFNYSADPASVILPPSTVAYTGVVLTQTLLSKHPDTQWLNYSVGSASKQAIVNTTILPVNQGVFAHLEMFPNYTLSQTCQQPFGMLLGTTFDNDRVAIITMAAGNNGSWYTTSRPTALNLTILVCDNVTICHPPSFLRHGPAGASFWGSVFTRDDNNTCYYFEHFEVNITQGFTRRSIAFYFEDGDLFLYFTDFLPSSYKQSAPLQLFRRIPVGANLPNVQFFGGISRSQGSDKCTFAQFLQLAYLTLNSVMVEYDQNGLISNGAFCGADPASELVCVAGTFQPVMGLYSLSQYRVQANQTVVRTHRGNACSIPYGVMKAPPQPIRWQRFTFGNCTYNYSAIVSTLHNYDVYCKGISAYKLNELCFGGVTLDIMRITQSDYSSFKGGIPTDFTTYNYQISDSFVGCVHAYWLNDTSDDKYALASHYPAVKISPGGRQSDSSYINTVINSATTKWCANSLCLGLAVISVSTANARDAVCPVTLNNTDIVENLCVNYNVYGYSGVGVIKKMTNFTIPNDKLFLGSSAGGVSAFRGDNGAAYSISPCASASVTAGYVPGYNSSLLFNGITCNLTKYAVVLPTSVAWRERASAANDSVNALDLSIGCLVGVDNKTDLEVSNCSMPLGNSYCLQPPNETIVARSAPQAQLLQLVVYNPYVNTSVKPITPTDFVDVPINFTIVASTEYIQTYADKVTIDCVRYLCGDSSACQALLSQYGTFCVDINKALTSVHTLLDESVLSLVSDLTSGTQPISSNSSFTDVGGDYNLTVLLGCLGTDCTTRQSRSFITDLLYDKITMADPGFMDAYQKCLEQATGAFSNTDVRDLICTQTFNGISVLPPIVSAGMQAVYTSALTGGIASSSWTFGLGSLAVIPFANQLQYRLNGIGVTMDVLSQNQKLIANAFNNALVSIQEGFNATNLAIQKIQSAINTNAAQLNNLVAQLSNNFGAVSSSINEIYSRLDTLEANAQVDRLINGRFAALNTYVTQLLIRASELRAAATLASQKFSECVKSQSLRYDFCGEGRHVISFPQQAPNGVMFIHYSYKPTAYKHVCTTAGLCVNGTGYVPLSGIFVQASNSCDGAWLLSSRDFYSPTDIQYSLLRRVDKCEANYSVVNNTVFNPSDVGYPDFSHLIESIYQNVTKRINFTIDAGMYNFTGVNLSSEISTLHQALQKLNESFIDLKELGTYTKIVRWPWYVWLGFIAGLVGLALAVVLLLCMTNCCSCFKGACNCRLCRYDDYEEVYPAVRTNKRRA
ncbi:spike glycoprotein [Pteropus rufus nobecovirus]|nr:spike glycoprotein [Pteropus rufus nobecovirus]